MQYEAKFNSLSRYAPHFVSIQKEKCHKFLRGLRDQLRLALMPFDISEFLVLVERVRRVENEARVFNITPQETKDSEEVVTELLLISNKFDRVIFYSGTSHSFISKEFYSDLSIVTTCFSPTLSIKMPMGDSLPANRMCLINLNIQGYKFPT
ncbi:hypothetical protein MA16_Dca025310 [Dendrobium catenatum]|uniref:Retrotransposon gag domain-containing protein n=1 Tax=Dendrobium catenatum TaxID=906689 RepID=A0A2I0VHF1_9ASPA|nr:hypothetical protein MA16_Dca025310 [Dendrobium catenatum]